MSVIADADFAEFVGAVRPRLIRALTFRVGPDRAEDASDAAIAYAWERWAFVQGLDNPAGYLYRVALTRTRERRKPRLPLPSQCGLPDVEPKLVPALLTLPLMQRTCIWLVYGCEWTYAETAEALNVGTSTVGTHLTRGLVSLRTSLGASDG